MLIHALDNIHSVKRTDSFVLLGVNLEKSPSELQSGSILGCSQQSSRNGRMPK